MSVGISSADSPVLLSARTRVVRERGCHAKSDVGRPREALLNAKGSRSAAEPLSGAPGGERIRAVGDDGHRDEDETESDRLQRRRTTRRIDELWQEREEEESRLRIQRIDEYSLPEGLS